MISKESKCSIRTLVVDDDYISTLLLKTILTQHGYPKVVTTTSSEDAVQLYMENKFDLILLDIEMPVTNGFDLLDRFRGIDGARGIPVIYISARTDLKTKEKAFKKGAFDYLTKPVDMQALIGKIRALFNPPLETRMIG